METMAEAASAELSDLLGKVIAAAPECIRRGVLLKAVDWRGVAPGVVADMLARIEGAGVQLPLWLAEALLLAGHHLGETPPRELPPLLRALDAVNALPARGSRASGDLESALAALMVEDAGESAALNALLRQLCEKGLAGLAAPLAIRSWPHAARGGAALQSAVRGEMETYPQLTLRLLCLSTADMLAEDLKPAFAALGVAAHIETRPFAQLWPELMQPDDGCDARLLVLDADSLFTGEASQREQRCAEQVQALANAIERALTATLRPLIVSTIPAPAAPAAGYVDGWRAGGLRQAIDEANRRLYDLARRHSRLTVIDADVALAAVAPAGRCDPKLWHYARLAFSPAASRALAAAFAGAWGSLNRHGAKVLALDLDNTLWGGIVGEDGVAGVACGSEFPGSAYRAFQEECLRLKSQGMLLAILSKNDPAAIETFASRADMPLKAGDFAGARINWRPKPENIRELAAELNLGLDSFLFLDDSAHERDAMRRMCPEVIVPEMPGDPARRPGWLRGLRQTWPVALTREDAQRAQFYAAERKAAALRASASSFEDFLAGLEQQVLIARTDAATVGRVAQMHARTNQFNLTTTRFDEAALRAMLADPDHYSVLHAQVRDKFGDHGIAIAAVLRFEAGAAHIASLLMSCRVIGRRVEHAFLAGLIDHALGRGAERICGAWRPTGRNGIVRDFYRAAGFECLEETERGSAWARTLTDEPAVPGPPRPGLPWVSTSEQGACIR
jgi:FkbH-like protein